MLPAMTCSPPYRLTPRYLGLLVRPFRLEPTPFLCAMPASAQLQVGDADLGELLPMSGLAAVILPPLEFEHVDLGFLPLAHDFGRHRRALHQRSSGLDGLAVGGEQDLVEGHLGAGGRVHERQPEGLALFRPELLAEGSE